MLQHINEKRTAALCQTKKAPSKVPHVVHTVIGHRHGMPIQDTGSRTRTVRWLEGLMQEALDHMVMKQEAFWGSVNSKLA